VKSSCEHGDDPSCSSDGFPGRAELQGVICYTSWLREVELLVNDEMEGIRNERVMP
jgi:hypothetical protein